MPIIVLEGCDGTGKSTLARALQEKTGFPIVQGSSFEISKLGVTEMYTKMMELINTNNIIIDRFYLSNYVYGNLFDYPTMTRDMFSTLAQKTEENALTVYLTAATEIIQNRILERGDKDIKVQNVPAILKKYEEGLRNPTTAQAITLTFDTSFHQIHNSASTIVNFAHMTERQMYVKKMIG